MRKFVDILKIVWQMPQIIFGCIYLLFLKIIGGILMKTNYKGIDVYRKKSKGGVSLGNKIFISPRGTERTVMHEWGHTRQSLILGPFYLFVIGIPSILWAMTHKTLAPNKSYYWFFTERIANKLGGVV